MEFPLVPASRVATLTPGIGEELSKKAPELVQIEPLQEEPLTVDFEFLENPEEGLHSPTAKEGLKKFNAQLANVADRLAASRELNGLFLLGLGGQLTSAGLSLVAKETIDQQNAGTAIIRRFEQILPDRFKGDSQDSFVWSDPNTSKKYRFELSGGDAIQLGEKVENTPRVLRGVELFSQGKEKNVFLASTLDAKNWRIEQCDFSLGQIESLTKARRQVDSDRSPVPPTVLAADSYCL